jgi:hypothetical protein
MEQRRRGGCRGVGVGKEVEPPPLVPPPLPPHEIAPIPKARIAPTIFWYLPAAERVLIEGLTRRAGEVPAPPAKNAAAALAGASAHMGGELGRARKVCRSGLAVPPVEKQTHALFHAGDLGVIAEIEFPAGACKESILTGEGSTWLTTDYVRGRFQVWRLRTAEEVESLLTSPP